MAETSTNSSPQAEGDLQDPTTGETVTNPSSQTTPDALGATNPYPSDTSQPDNQNPTYGDSNHTDPNDGDTNNGNQNYGEPDNDEHTPDEANDISQVDEATRYQTVLNVAFSHVTVDKLHIAGHQFETMIKNCTWKGIDCKTG